MKSFRRYVEAIIPEPPSTVVRHARAAIGPATERAVVYLAAVLGRPPVEDEVATVAVAFALEAAGALSHAEVREWLEEYGCA